MTKIPFRAGTAFLLGALLPWLLPLKGYAQESGALPGNTRTLESSWGENLPEAPLEVLDTILSSPDFGGDREGWGIRFKKTEEAPERKRFAFDSSSWVERIKWVFAIALRMMLIIALISLGVFSLLYLLKRKPRKKPAPGNQKSYGIALDRKTPEGLLAYSRQCYAQGRMREAWASCLGAVIAALAQKGLPIPPGATEYDCLGLVRQTLPDDTPGFAGLLRYWIPLAYGGEVPEEGPWEASLRFCESLLDRRKDA